MVLKNLTNFSLWDATAGACPEGQHFEDGKTCDVVIIGGGITGVAAGLTLARGGANVALIEATAPGSGATGRSAGFIVPAFSTVSPARVIKEMGEMGERLVSLVAESADEVFSLVRKHQIQCEAQQNGWFQPVKSKKAFARIQESADVWRSFGAEGSLHDSMETQQLTGTRGYAGCWQAKTGGTLHPIKFVYGLLSCAIDQGLGYYSDTEATAFSNNGSVWKVTTNKGNLFTDTVLICSNAQSPQISRSLYRSIVPLQVCQIATKPVPENQRKHLIQQGQSLTDTQINLFSYRFDGDWRLISGAIPVLPFGNGTRVANSITRRLQRELSLISEPEAEFIWVGEASVTPDFLPRLYEIESGAYAITACNGRGLALSTTMGQRLAQALLTRSFSDLPLTVQRPVDVKGRSVKIFGTRLYPIYGFVRDFLKV